MNVDDSDGPLTLDRLKDHYKHCIRLSASNKINAKNAFLLQLINYMQDLVSQTEDGQMNFKIASSALDAGAKIYSHRVDCVHSEAQKVASSILMAFNEQQDKSKHQNDTGDNNNSQANDSNLADSRTSNDAEEAEHHRRKKRTLKTVKTIADDKTINGNFEKIVIGDAYLSSLTQECDISSPAALICYNPLTQPSCLLTIESKYLRKSYTETERLIEPNSQPQIDTSACVSLISKSNNCAQIIQANKSNRICPRLKNFLFNDRTTTISGFNSNSDEPSIIQADNNNHVDQNRTSNNHCGEHGFDPDTYDVPVDDDFGDVNMADCDDTQVPVRNENEDLILNLDIIAAQKPQEYGYLEKPRLINTWAGPHAWKAVKIPQTAKKDAGSKSTRKRARVEQKPIDFSEDINTSLEEFGDKEVRHSAEVIRKWKKPLLPQDYNLTDEDIRATVIHTFLKPEDTYHCKRTAAEALIEVNKDHSYVANDDDNHSISPDMNFDNVHEDSDDEFRADPVVDGNEVALFGAQINNTLTQNADMEFAGENLIEQPYSVTQIHIPFAKIAKKMDVRKLKKVMWDLLSGPDKSMNVSASNKQLENGNKADETIVEMNNMSNGDVEKTLVADSTEHRIRLEFLNLYGDLPTKVSPKMSQDLSQPIAFVTLLHLANEKNLKLIPKTDLKDFVIEQDEK